MFKELRYLLRKYFPFLRKERIQRVLRTRSTFRFSDRQAGKSKLLILVCGYKRPLWPYFFNRIEQFLPKDWDVCMVCPGFTKHPELEKKCEENGWSIILCYQNKISKAKNIAILNHPKAELIMKLDEDIMITEDFFGRMIALHEHAEASPEMDVAYVAPLLHINGYSYHRVLDQLNAEAEYKSKFGPLKSACVDIPAWSDPEAAVFLWDQIAPIDETAERLYRNQNEFTVCPHRFSIGAFLFKRSLWEDLNYFKHGPDGYLGIEEIQLAEHCAAESLHVVVSDEILVGHFSFGPQYNGMLEKLNEDDSFLRIGSRASGSPVARPSQA
ncbi:hypothetical protein GYB22_03245 [bacterium]|nr:hypothetical protein [bacterium]